ncbi:MAG: hypothetical protein F8N36_14295 [Desulfovibrio sp.]|uniref:hypothetical protein n=1 Tax=Desulfovibrio sp. TaxID=885 RepID=UPI00135E6133|nr:hypothetical protein [Desulfovibrio sp.]MTJ94008.1 hypothetical protein [Desulfovibrio sp.]
MSDNNLLEQVKKKKVLIALAAIAVIYVCWTHRGPSSPGAEQSVDHPTVIHGQKLFHVIDWPNRAHVSVPNSWCRYGKERWGELGPECHLNEAEREPPRCFEEGELYEDDVRPEDKPEVPCAPPDFAP